MNLLIPEAEGARLKALREYNILDTPAEQCYDDFTVIAANLCETPIALISLIDEHRQWFKSKRGLDLTEGSRETAFCAHTILGDALLEVEDAQEDPRFADNPMVLGTPGIRFYAGAPLTTPEGHNIGSLCVIDRKPRQLTLPQQEVLAAMARQIVSQMELRRVSSLLAKTLEELRHLEGILPICSYCKSIRDDDGQWSSLESFLLHHSDACLSHGICPGCMSKHFPKDADVLKGN